MKRITFKKLKEKVDEINDETGLDLYVFPNMYGYGVTYKRKLNMGSNLYNGSASECMAFLRGLEYGVGITIMGLKFENYLNQKK